MAEGVEKWLIFDLDHDHRILMQSCRVSELEEPQNSKFFYVKGIQRKRKVSHEYYYSIVGRGSGVLEFDRRKQPDSWYLSAVALHSYIMGLCLPDG